MNYPGQKNIPGVIHKIVNEIPKHSYYYELFAGSAAIAKALPSAGTVKHLNDLNKTVLDQITIPPGHTVIKTSVRALDIIHNLTTATTDTFLFLDPPYLHHTRYNNSLYKFEMSETDHIQLLSAVKLLHCNCMIIHPDCKLYNDALQSWSTVQLKIRYHKKTSIEKLYMNYSVPTALQTYKFIGTDCWDRQRIKRKAQRFLKKGLHIPFPEATYITDIIPEVQL